jgi:hypothetical protein
MARWKIAYWFGWTLIALGVIGTAVGGWLAADASSQDPPRTYPNAYPGDFEAWELVAVAAFFGLAALGWLLTRRGKAGMARQRRQDPVVRLPHVPVG